jgi:hypothetical protein
LPTSTLGDPLLQVVDSLTGGVSAEYGSLSDKLVWGQVHNTMYTDIMDYVNFRMETADSCLSLVRIRRIADALGLCRSVLEHYLLLVLMSRGSKYFVLQDFTNLSEGQFKAQIEELQQHLAAERAAGQSQWLTVEAYPREKRKAMWVAEGLKGGPEAALQTISLHYFKFQDFQPETMRLDDNNYAQAWPPGPEFVAARKQRRIGEQHNFRHYLSYDGLLQCLVINDLADKQAIARIEAHYTFLGTFLHPTHRAARKLNERYNSYANRTTIGMEGSYTDCAVLLTYLYVLFLITGLIEEFAGLLEAAPPDYFTDPGTRDLRQLTQQVPRRFSYFWFLFNPPPLWDKFNYACTLSEEELSTYPNYAQIPDTLIPFDKDVYGHLRAALSTRWHPVVGQYVPPRLA